VPGGTNELMSAEYTSNVDEKQFLNVQKWCKFRESKIEVGLWD